MSGSRLLPQDRVPRFDLIVKRWVWRIAHAMSTTRRESVRQPWTTPRQAQASSPRRTIGMATVTPEMVAEASVAAGWPPVMTLHEAAEAMRISPQTLRRYVSEGKFKRSVKRGWPVLFWRDSLLSEFMKGPPR